jgi:hypothetical protein
MAAQNGNSNPKPEAKPEAEKPQFKTLAVQVSTDVHRNLRVLAAQMDTTIKNLVEQAVAAFIKNEAPASK